MKLWVAATIERTGLTVDELCSGDAVSSFTWFVADDIPQNWIASSEIRLCETLAGKFAHAVAVAGPVAIGIVKISTHEMCVGLHDQSLRLRNVRWIGVLNLGIAEQLRGGQ